MLDSPGACMEELAAVNDELGEFGHEWASAAGELKTLLKRHERLTSAALRGLKGADLTVPEKQAAAEAAVEASEQGSGLAERIEELEGQVEKFKTRFKVLERRSGNAQSVLGAYRDESRMADRQDPTPQPTWGAGR